MDQGSPHVGLQAPGQSLGGSVGKPGEGHAGDGAGGGGGALTAGLGPSGLSQRPRGLWLPAGLALASPLGPGS